MILVVELLICVIVAVNTQMFIQNLKKNARQMMASWSSVMAQNDAPAMTVLATDHPDLPGIVEQQIKSLLIQSAIILGVSLVVSFFAISGVMRLRVIKPLKQLAAAGQQLAEGQFVQTFHIGQQSPEIAALATVFENLARYWQHTAATASEITRGILVREGNARSPHDALSNALREMARYQQQIVLAAAKMKDGDFTATVQPRSTDDVFGREIHAVATGFNDLLRQIKTNMEQMSSTGATISTSAEREMSIVRDVHASAQMMLSIMTDIGGHTEEVAHSMETLSPFVEETSASVAQMATSITHIATHSQKLTQQTEEAFDFLAMTVNALQEIVKMTETSRQLSEETMQDALGGQQAVEQVMSSMSLLQRTVTTTVDAITTFAHRSREIDTILDVIQEITERTSLLALNASIIAAQAGVHGRGFAVVADEIKNLALGVATSTKDIAAIVRSLQQDIQRVVESIHAGENDVKQGMERTRQAEKALQTIISSAKHSSSMVISIVAALDELMTTSQEVSNSMGQVNLMTEEISTAAREHEFSTKQINQAITHINDMTAHIQHATDQQSAGTRQALNATHAILDLMNQNLESSRQIALSAEELSAQVAPILHTMNRLILRS